MIWLLSQYNTDDGSKHPVALWLLLNALWFFIQNDFRQTITLYVNIECLCDNDQLLKKSESISFFTKEKNIIVMPFFLFINKIIILKGCLRFGEIRYLKIESFQFRKLELKCTCLFIDVSVEMSDSASLPFHTNSEQI